MNTCNSKLLGGSKGVPTVTPPSRRGIGTRVIDRVVSMNLDATVTPDYAASGSGWTLVAPISSIQEDEAIETDHAIRTTFSS